MLAGLALLLAPATAPAQVSDKATYNIAKNITVTGPAAQGGAPTATMKYFDHAWVDDPTDKITGLQNQVNPVQGVLPHSYEGFPRKPDGSPDKSTIMNGFDRPNLDGAFPLNPQFRLSPISVGSENVTPQNKVKTFTAEVGPAGNNLLSAEAKSHYDVTLPTAANNTLTAYTQAEGNRSFTPQDRLPGAETYAFSYAGLEYDGKATKNVGGNIMNINVKPAFILGRQQFGPGAKDFTWINDPVRYNVTDADNKSLLSGTAIDLHAGTVDNANISLDSNNHVHIDALPGGGEALLSISLSGDIGGTGGIGADALAPAGNAGTLLIDIVNQQVTQESATGVFSSLALPGLNTLVSSLDFNLPTDLFSFNLTMPDGAQNFELNFDDVGFTDGAAVPAPPSLVLILPGILGLPALAWFRRRAVLTQA
jgi:hypothetical protein